MKEVTNECVCCDLPCLGSSCPNRNVVNYYCDFCGEEGKLYDYDGFEICEECLLKQFKVIEGSDY